ncbi:MAG: NAD-dependent epimerase/dehydratase family protein [Bacteroidetes bacterium]|nr:NAD-dependent epimerase/dehydratase family protein [Bacteroidota bacterium]
MADAKHKILTNQKILVTGGAGFIGSNLVEHFLKRGNTLVCLDDLSTGYMKNIELFMDDPSFSFIEGDIRDLSTCQKAAEGCDYIFHQAALGSVPRSVADPHTTNAVNINGSLNMLISARDQKVKRFIYAASSSTYGDSKELPKVEDKIGNPLSPYAVTKFVMELYARVFSDLYNMECIGLRYFNVFGGHQDPEGAYAAVIPLWVKQLIAHKAPVINGDGTYSRDFTYINNVVQANELAAVMTTEAIIENLGRYYNWVSGTGYRIPGGEGSVPENDQKKKPGITRYPVSEVFNVAYGGNTTLNELFEALRKNLSQFDSEISGIAAVHGPNRAGDIPHSMASIDKARMVLDYEPLFDAAKGFEMACGWYFENL